MIAEAIQQKTLFERLGGTSGITALVTDSVDAHMKNPVIKARFLPYLEKPEYLKVVKQHLCDFMIAGSGGPAEYRGRDMASTHRGMNINEAEYMAAIDDILMVMDAHQIDGATRKDVLAILYSLKSDIIGK